LNQIKNDGNMVKTSGKSAGGAEKSIQKGAKDIYHKK
jgi:hypothetical protein